MYFRFELASIVHILKGVYGTVSFASTNDTVGLNVNAYMDL